MTAGANSTKSVDRDGRSAARLAAVQAIYQMELTGLDAEAVAREFIEHRFEPKSEFSAITGPDVEFFADIVRGVPHHQTEIDGSITMCLSEGWKLSRIDSILRAIMRAAGYEMIARTDVPAKVIIDQYIDIAHAFFDYDEVGFVNAALDRLARSKRVAEMSEAPADDQSSA